jgi:hypothetical protein
MVSRRVEALNEATGQDRQEVKGKLGCNDGENVACWTQCRSERRRP